MKNYVSPIGRREFIKRSSCVIGGSVLIWPACTKQPTVEWKSLTAEEAKLIVAMSARVIPTDDTAGAVEAGVVHYIDEQLSSHYRKWKLLYQQGLKDVEKVAYALHQKPFEALTTSQMDRLLERIENETLPEHANPGRFVTRFFNLFIDHCMQGFYGDPRHGGNRNWVSYQMLDLRVIDPETVKIS